MDRLVAYGYRHDDVLGPRPIIIGYHEGTTEYEFGEQVVLPGHRKPVPEVRIKVVVNGRKPRKYVQRSLGPVVPGYCVPIPDTHDTITLANGVAERMGRDINSVKNPLPTPQEDELLEFSKFVDKVLRTVEPLQAGLDMSVETWLSKTQNYSLSRKQQLLEVAQSMSILVPKKIRRVGKDFGKLEHLPKAKACRSINSPEDEVKVRLGPAARYMEEATYSNTRGWKVRFIKHVPMCERAQYIHDHLSANCTKANATDYTCFECSFSRQFQLVCEQKYYAHMLKNYPETAKLFLCMTDVNTMRSSNGVTLKTVGRRMSGEMVTSLGNGVSNAILLMYFDELTGAHMIGGVVEGDDALFSSPRGLDMSRAKRLGFIVKQEVHDSLGQAGFCGMLYDETENVAVSDPQESRALPA